MTAPEDLDLDLSEEAAEALRDVASSIVAAGMALYDQGLDAASAAGVVYLSIRQGLIQAASFMLDEVFGEDP